MLASNIVHNDDIVKRARKFVAVQFCQNSYTR